MSRLPTPAHVASIPEIHYVSLHGIKEDRPIALVTDTCAWSAISASLTLDVTCQLIPTDATAAQFELLARAVPAEAKAIYAVGGGLPVDAAKFCALRTGLPLVAIPTALSVDAHLTAASGIRKNGCVHYIPTPRPDTLYVDLEVIEAAPSWVRAAGICDLLSIATGLWDWQLAEANGKNPPHQRVISYAVAIAETILEEAIAIASSAGRGDYAGLAQLLELLVLEVQLCNLIGHSRPEEGSEHAFAYSVENLVGKGLPHGDLVGPGILAIAAAQGQKIEELRSALLASGARLDRISATQAADTLGTLSQYAITHDLPFGVCHQMDEQLIEAALGALW